MNCEEYLTKHISTLDSFQKMSLEDFIRLDMFIFKDIDIDCNLNNPLFVQGEFVRLDTAVYLGCIEENKIKFYDIKRGQFAKIPIKDVEMSWAF